MELFKQGVGFILLAIAAWMITVYPAEGRAGLLYFSVAVGFCVWMWGRWVDYGTKFSRKITVRVIAAALAVWAGVYFLSPAAKLIDWQNYDGEMIAKALSEKRPVLIKFTADWCMSCKAVEGLVYSREDIAKLIKDKKVLAVKADTTVKDYPATFALKDVYKEPGVPVSILLMPGKEEAEKRWRGKAFGNELKEELKKLP
jgi:thiol:disulfide interchange protein DsbD